MLILLFSDDQKSIQQLTAETARCFDHEKVRACYVAAQVADVGLKIDLATNDVMRIYKQTIQSAAVTNMAPLAITTTRITVAALVCKSVVQSFGIPSVTPATVQQIVRNIVVDDMGHNASVFMAEAAATTGVVGTFVLGGIPVFLATALIAASLAIPTISRLILMLACDVTLILKRAFKECTKQALGQPRKQNIERAAAAYHGPHREVHREIKALVPPLKFINGFRFEKIKTGYKRILEEHIRSFANDGSQSSLLVVK